MNRGLAKELTGDIDGACADWKNAVKLGNTIASNFTKECK
jgi:hypothetical protein